MLRAVVFGGGAALLVSLAACAPAGGGEDGGAACEGGTQGCACVAGRCGRTASGEQLVCMGDVCEVMACPAGQSGCACRAGTQCNAPGDACTNGFCIAAGCEPGSANCNCVAGTCDVGFMCLDDTVCVSNKGYEGGECLDTGRCYRGNRCDPTTGRCTYCEPGTPGCQCTAAGGCNSGLACIADLCVAATALPPPSPACYTPCSGDLTSGGQTTTCGPDGLLPGCLSGQSCVQGSCLNPGETKETCVSDVDCPFFQVCLQGGCYSNCDVNADCPTGLGCFKHACRPTCRVTTGQAACPSGYACSSNDGQNGFCVPIGRTVASQATAPNGGIKLPVSSLELSNVKQSGEVIIVPRSNITQDISVRRKWHEISFSNGDVERVEAPTRDGGLGCNAAANECPLRWVELGATGVAPSLNETFSFRLPPQCRDVVTEGPTDGGAEPPCPRLLIGKAGNLLPAGGRAPVRWRGVVEIKSASGGAEDVLLTYVQRPDGQWTGSMYYFGQFNDVGMVSRPDAGFVGWSDRTNKETVNDVANGLVQSWGALRGRLLNDGWAEFLDILTSTRTESWKFAEVRRRCGSATAACYPFNGPGGVRTYVNNVRNIPIPSGVTELPVALNLQINAGQPTLFEGRVESSMAMHYPGNPAIKLEFDKNPADAASCEMSGGDCLVYLKTTGATAGANALKSTVGGRFISTDGQCPTGFTAVQVPWLVPGFDAFTTSDGMGQRTRTECRDNERPFVAAFKKTNETLAGGNPVPDGTARERTLRFLDGALVNQSEIFVLFEESYDSFIPGQPPTRAYGYMRLKRAAADLDAMSYSGVPTNPMPNTASTLTGARCNPELLKLIPNYDGGVVSPLQASSLVNQLLSGKAVTSDYQCLAVSGTPGVDCYGAPPVTSGELAANNIHYWCEDTGYFNGGPRDDGSSTAVKVECPAGSRRIFFNAGARTAADLAREACQTSIVNGRATCFNTLEGWRTSTALPAPIAEYEPVFRCANPNQVFCDDNRQDLRVGKVFFKRQTTAKGPNMIGLRALVDSAFRYKTRFRSTSGGTLGFAPRQCVPNSDAVPYCYSPAEIQEARERIDCLVDIYSRDGLVQNASGGPGTLDTPTRTALTTYLKGNFAAHKNDTTTGTGAGEGFERLYAELLINQGDESLTSAFASRFDLAAAGGASFRGSVFEENGIDLTGVAGAEMYQLYQATQYYQLALDRLYRFGPNMGTAQRYGTVGTDLNFVTPETVTNYLERLVRAASQKSRAWAEIAKRYQNFNRPDLARRVIERSYVGTYLESALISRLMITIWLNSPTQSVEQISVAIEKAQRNYRMALLDMREVYAQVTDEVNYFGYPADYIPFPPLDAASTSSANAIDSLNSLARQRLDLAKQRETVALSSAKQGRVDAVQFQSDLTSIRNTYENQLAQACGTFKGEDGRVYPAIKKYAHQNSVALLMGDPCGRMGNGDIHNAMANVKDSELKLKGVLTRHEAILQDVQIERERVAQVCGLMTQQVDYQFNTSKRVIEVNKEMAEQRALVAFIQSSVEAVMSSIEVLDCEIQCASSAAMAAAVTAAGLAAAGTNYATERRIIDTQADLQEFEASAARTIANFNCNGSAAGQVAADGGQLPGILQVESNAKIASLLNNTMEVKLEALRAEYGLRVAVAEVGRLFNSAQRLQAQQEEAEQLSIDIQQAQNDPNVRIYQNDAVINADISFKDALAVAYRLTRVYEYYTSQSYAKKEQLFLIRMVSAGQYNLENYLLELENEFIAFEEDFGNPDVRVMALSLRDDILKIPFLDPESKPYDEDTRIKMMRERLRDTTLVDARGYLTLPFSTNINAVSPVTRNHKIRHVEVDLQGNRMGDSIARIYLRMAGTGVVRNVSDDLDYYVFPERLSVVNASILGSKVFDPEIYRNYRFRDRPLVNTLWELVINQRDELANKDIDLGTLSDVRLLIYYSDFTTY